MVEILSNDVERFVRAVGPTPDEVLREMDAVAESSGFPHVGPEVGAVLRVLARAVGAERVFEFGSGFGYSAYWIAAALPADGELVLTEVDEDELERAREFLAAGGYDHLARYERGDALETVDRYEGPFDVVLLDHDKPRYPEAFDAVREKVPVGGIVVADNAITASVIEFDALLERVTADRSDGERGRRGGSRGTDDDARGREDGVQKRVDGDPLEGTNEPTRGIATYLKRLRSDPDFETVVLPLGEGLAVSYRIA